MPAAHADRRSGSARCRRPSSKASAVALPGGRLLVLGGEVGGVVDRPDPARDARARCAAAGVCRWRRTTPRPRCSVGASSSSAAGRRSRRTRSCASTRRRDAARRRERSTSRSPTSAPPSSAARPISSAATPDRRLRTRSCATAARGLTTTVARLPAGTRYAGVAALGGKIVVAGGPDARRGHVGGLLRRPEAHRGGAAHRNASGAGGSRRHGRARRLPLPRRRHRRASHRGRLRSRWRLACPVPLADPAVVAVGGRLVIVGGGTSGVYAYTPR